MSKESFKVSGHKFELPSTPGRKWKFTPRPGGWWIAESIEAAGKAERKRLALFTSRGRAGASLSGRLYQGDWIASARGGHATEQDLEAQLTAQFPGKVRKILVQAGQEVAAGEKLVLIEAMKMEFAISAPGPARIKKILVKENQQLSPGDLFLELEPKDSPNGS